MDCKQLSKAYIAKLISENPAFANLAESIQREKAVLRETPDSLRKWITENYYDEILERAYYSTILDFPSNNLQKQNILDAFEKDIPSWVNFLKMIDSVSDSYIRLPDESIDDIVKSFNVDADEFWSFINRLQQTARIKTIDTYVNSKKFSIRDVLNRGLDKELTDEIKEINQTFDKYFNELWKYTVAEIKKFNSKNSLDSILKAWNIKIKNKQVRAAVEETYNKLVKPVYDKFYKQIINNTNTWTDLYKEEIEAAKKEFAYLTEKEFKSIMVDEALKNNVLDAYKWFSDEFLSDINKEIEDQLIDTSELKWIALKTANSSNEKVLTRKNELFGNYLLSRALLWWDLNFNEVSKYIAWNNVWAIDINTIDSVTDINDLRIMLYTDLPSFKNEELYTAWKGKYDELVFWKWVKEKRLLDRLEKYTKSPNTLLEEIIKSAPKKSVKKNPWTAISQDKISNAMLYSITWKKVDGDFVFYKKDLSWYSEKSMTNYNAFKNEIRKRSIEVWEVKTVDIFWARDNPNVTIVVENLDDAKALNDLPNNVVFPEEGKKFNFYTEWNKLYVWTKNDKDFTSLTNRLDSSKIPFNTKDLSDWYDYVEAVMKERFWADYKAVQDLLNRISPNYTEQEKFLDDLAKADLRYEPATIDIREEIANLPDDIEWYKIKAIELADKYGFEIEEKEVMPLNEIKRLYASTVYTKSPEDWIDNTNDFLDAFWVNGTVIENNNNLIFWQATKIITNDWFSLPMYSYKSLFEKIMNGWDISNDYFVKSFISTNEWKIESLPWLTNIDKFKLYIKEKITQAKRTAWAPLIEETASSQRTFVESREVINTRLYWEVEKVKLRTSLWGQSTVYFDWEKALLMWIFAKLEDGKPVKGTKTYETILEFIKKEGYKKVRIVEPTVSSNFAVEKLVKKWILKETEEWVYDIALYDLYFKRNEDAYTNMIAENLSVEHFKASPNDIDKDFWVIWTMLDEHYNRIEKIINDGANELEIYNESKRIKRAIAEYEERILMPKYYGKYLNNKDILTRRYSVLKASTVEDLELLKWNIEEIKNNLSKIFRKTDPTDSNLDTLRKEWVAYHNNTSINIDELIERELLNIDDEAWDLALFKDIDISKMNLDMKYSLRTNLKATNLLNKVWDNIQKHLYEKIVPELNWFFDAYRVENVDWVGDLPLILARTNVTANMWKDSYIPSLSDIDIKKAIFDQVSDQVKKWTLTDDSLDKIVERELNNYFVSYVDNKGFDFKKVKEGYKEIFKPYKLLFRLPQDAVKSFYDWLKNQFDKLDKTFFDSAYVNIDWKKVSLDSIDFAPELTLPKVLNWDQTFSSRPLSQLDKTYISNLESRAKLVRDWIEEVDEILAKVQMNFWNDASKVMAKSPRLNRLREVIVGWISKAKSAGKTLRRYASADKEKILKFQKQVNDFMDLSDEQFWAFKNWSTDSIAKDAWEVADYFRYLNRTLPNIPDDSVLKEAFWATHKKPIWWLTIDSDWNPIDTKLTQQKLEWLAAAVWEQQIFSFIDYNPSTWRGIKERVSQTGWFLWKYNPAWKIDDVTELNQFNKTFQADLSMRDYQTIIVALSDFNPKGWLSATSRWIKKAMNRSFLGWRWGRILTSYPHVLSTLFTQYAWYYTLWEWYQRFLWNKATDWITKIRRDLWVLTWEIPEWSRDPKMWANMKTWEWLDLFDTVRENWNNFMDILASWRVKDQVFIDAITYNTARNFHNLADFEDFIKNADAAERTYVLDAINNQANTLFDNMMWFKTQAIYKGWNIGVLWNLYTIYNSVNWFRSGRWMNVARRFFDNTFGKAWEAARYFSSASNRNAKWRANFVDYLSRDRDFQIFKNTVMFDAYYAMKLKRFMNLTDDEKEDESFWDFIWNELTDYEWWVETLWAMSQSYQGIYSAWPLRPLLYAVEAQLWGREWSFASAFIDWLKWSAFRQFKLLYNTTYAWARFAWEAQRDWVDFDDAYTIISDMLFQSSWWTLRFLLNDKDYQKNLFYVPDQNSWLEFFFGLSNNPYVSQERRVQQITSWITLENSISDAMQWLWDATYVGKLWNLLWWTYWIVSSLKYWSFDKNFNTVTKEDFTKIFEGNSVYQWYIQDWNINTSVIPPEYKDQFYKNTYEKITANWYFPWWPKQIDAMNEWLKNFKDEEWLEKQYNRWWMDAARVELMNFLWEKEVRSLVEMVENVNVKKNQDDVKEDMVYKTIKEKINAVAYEKRPYWYLYLDMAHYLTRDQSKKWKSEAEFNQVLYSRLDNMLNTFMKQDSYELRQEIYTDTRDKTMLEAVYYSDKESFNPFFTVEKWDYWKETIKFDGWFNGYLKSMNEVLISAKDDNLDSFEVAFSSLVKSYKDNPVAQVAAYNELNQFLKWRKDIENKDDMLNWFLLKNPDLLKNPEELKLKIWVDQFNELITNIKDFENDISKKLIDAPDVTWKGWKGKVLSMPKITLPMLDTRWAKGWASKPSWRNRVKPMNISWSWSTRYGVNSQGKSIPKQQSYWQYAASSVNIYWDKKAWPKDISRKVKKITKKLLSKPKKKA